MPSPLKRSYRSDSNLARSFVKTVKSKISFTLFPDRRERCQEFHGTSNPRPRFQTYATVLSPSPRDHSTAPQHVHFIHRLPVELLAHVFVLGSETETLLPITISHVCHAWREIALRTPSLWRQICLTPREDMWRERIYRAKNCSLDVQLLPWRQTRSGRARKQFLDMYTVQKHMYLATPFIHRWRSLDILFADYNPFLWNAALSECCAASKRARAPLLEELSLVYRANDDTKEFCLFSGLAPRLRRVTLDGLRLTWLPSLFRNLTFLDYTHHGFNGGRQAVKEVLAMLEVSTRLVELRILFPRKAHIIRPFPTFGPIKRRVLLPALTRLHLRTDGGDIPFELWQLIALVSTPSLTSLRLIGRGGECHPFPNLHLFLRVYTMPRSIQMLYIENGWFDPQMVTRLLRELPNLLQLVVRRPHLPDQVIDLCSRVWNGWDLSRQVPSATYRFSPRSDGMRTLY